MRRQKGWINSTAIWDGYYKVYSYLNGNHLRIKIPQIILGGMWVQKGVCFLSTSLQKLYKPAGFSFAWKEAHG